MTWLYAEALATAVKKVDILTISMDDLTALVWTNVSCIDMYNARSIARALKIAYAQGDLTATVRSAKFHREHPQSNIQNGGL